jgi:hypothetical protein
VSETNDTHLADDVIAAYLDRALAAPARAVAEAHLADCQLCRDELVAAADLMRRASPSRRLLRIGAPTAAIAATLLLAVLGPWRSTSGPRSESGARLRETTGVATTSGVRVIAVAPADRATIPSDSVRFTWLHHARDAGYRLTLTDQEGAVRWITDTSDTVVALPDSVRLSRGRTYYWFVDALGGDGRTRASQLRSFRVAP